MPEWERIVNEMQLAAEQLVPAELTIDEAAASSIAGSMRILEKRRWMLERKAAP